MKARPKSATGLFRLHPEITAERGDEPILKFSAGAGSEAFTDYSSSRSEAPAEIGFDPFDKAMRITFGFREAVNWTRRGAGHAA